MDPPPSDKSEWRSTRNRPVAVNPRGGGLTGCEVRRRRVSRRWASTSELSPSPPPPPPRIKLPISPGRYGTLRSPPTVRSRPTWTGPPPPREEYVYVPRFQELTPSPPREDGSVRPPFRWATPHQATERPARRLLFSAAPSVEDSPQFAEQPPPSPPPSAVEEEGLTDSDPCPKGMCITIGMDFQSTFHSIPPQRSELFVMEKLIEMQMNNPLPGSFDLKALYR